MCGAIDTTLGAISSGTVHPHANARDTRSLFSKHVLNSHPLGAKGNKESRPQAMQVGAVAFLNKPFSDKQLLENIGRLENSKSGIDNVNAWAHTVARPTPADSAEATHQRSHGTGFPLTLPVAGGSPS